MRTWRQIKRNFIKITLALIVVLLFLNLFLNRKHSNNDNIIEQNGFHNNLMPKINVQAEKNDNSASLTQLIRDENVLNDQSIGTDNYQLPINNERLDSLFNILQEKESKYNSIMQKLDLFSFSDLVKSYESNGAFSLNSNKQYSQEINSFFQVKDKKIKSTSKLINELNFISKYYSFFHERNNIKPTPITSKDNKPVLITAANSGYYSPMQATVYLVHKYFPDYKLIIYDLGLSDDQYQTVRKVAYRV